MSWDSPGLEETRVRRVWLVSPALATLLFFIAQLFLARYGDVPRGVHGAAAQTPSAIPVNVRVVAQIKSADDIRPTARVPESESELLELFNKQSGVVFGTDVQEFESEVVLVRSVTFKR